MESNSKEDARDDIEGESGREEDEGEGPLEEDNSDPEWHDTHEILIAVHEEVNMERETLVSEDTLGGDDESVMGQHHAFGFKEAPKPHAAPATIAADPTWMSGDSSMFNTPLSIFAY